MDDREWIEQFYCAGCELLEWIDGAIVCQRCNDIVCEACQDASPELKACVYCGPILRALGGE